MKIGDPFLALTNISVTQNGTQILQDISLVMHSGEHWLIAGASGSGKTTLLKAIAGKIFHSGIVEKSTGRNKKEPVILLIEQQHHFRNLSNTDTFYYQQRFNSMDAGDSMNAGEYLGEDNHHSPWVAELKIAQLLSKSLIQLSNGENKRLQLVAALLQDPDILLLDNPFIGLDQEGRAILEKLLYAIADKGIHIILVDRVQERSPFITHIALLDQGRIKFAGPVTDLPTDAAPSSQHQHFLKTERLFSQRAATAEMNFEFAIRMKDVRVRYGDKMILDKLNWEVKKGDHWCIAGPNGSGKSTLLSLITGDNPQAYANEIYLFDRRRGTGESIWDIKKRVGYVSPELHLFFDRGETCYNVIASGLFDTIGLFRQLSASDMEAVDEIINLLQLTVIKEKRLFQLSLGQQRMILLGRALVKYPAMLVLDEPCQGLDAEQTEAVKKLIDMICMHSETTLLYVSHYAQDIPECVNNFLRLGSGEQ